MPATRGGTIENDDGTAVNERAPVSGELRKKGEGKRHGGAKTHIRLFLEREQFDSAEGLGSTSCDD
jgi:hypothetical protein